ncbi:MAG: LysM peptidoglycan-binding domain-containing protein [Victivallaceae bacterium]|nr:LysM peptidoglycan-binding domain-containing protein [Victivallaceae bacterium]
MKEIPVRFSLFTVVATVAALLAVAGCAPKDEIIAPRASIADGSSENDTAASAGAAATEQERADKSADGKADHARKPAAKQSARENAPAKYESMESVKNNYVTSSSVAAGNRTGAAKGAVYVVRNGDSIGKIAHMHGVKVSALLEANNLKRTSLIRIGQKLTIPGRGAKSSAHAAPAAKGAAKSVKSSAGVESHLYVVRSGDSIDRIARKLKVRRAALMEANNLTATSRLRVGQKLMIPGRSVKGESASVKSAKAGNTAAETPVAVKSDEEELKDIAGKSTPAEGEKTSEKNVTDAATPAGAAPATTAPVAGKEPVNAMPVQVARDTTVEVFAKEFGISVETLRKFNPTLPADGQLKKNTPLMIPMNN